MMSKFLEEDEVSITKTDGLVRCGVVIQTSDNVSSDDEDGETEESRTKIRKGAVRVAWYPDGVAEVIDENVLALADRSLMPGDTVRRLVAGQDSQRGYIANTRATCHLQLLSKNPGLFICDVPTCNLLPITPFDIDPGDVYLDSWVGRIERYVEKITLRFPDGARCEVLDEDLELFEDLIEKRDPDTRFASSYYYTGQYLRGELGMLERAVWLKSTMNFSSSAIKKSRSKDVSVVVENVVLEMVEVNWLCRGYALPTNISSEILEPPPKIITGTNLARLKLLDCFQSSSFQLGHKAYYTIKQSDTVVLLKSLDSHKLSGKLLQQVIHSVLNQRELLLPVVTDGKRQKPEVQNHVSDLVTKLADLENVELEASSAIQKSDNGIGSSDCEATSSAGEDCYDTEEELVSEDEDDDNDANVPSSNKASSTSGGGNSHIRQAMTRKHNKESGINHHLTGIKKQFRKRKRKATFTKLPATVYIPKPGNRIPVEIVFTRTIADVVWQDGTVEKEVPCTDLLSINHLDELEFFPGDFVVSTTDPRYDAKSGTYGVVQSVQHTGRMCKVLWMKSNPSAMQDEILESAETSVYDIKDHPDIHYRLGHVVVRVGGYKDAVETTELPAASAESDTAKTLSAVVGGLEMNGAVDGDVAEPVDLAATAAGQVCEMGIDGYITIQWADGSRSKCLPHQLYLVSDEMSDYDDLLSDDGDDEDETDTESARSSGDWETEDEVQVNDNEQLPTADSDHNITASVSDDVEDSTAELKSGIEAFIATMRFAISKLEETIHSRPKSDGPGTNLRLCRPIVQFYRSCRDFDRSLGTSIFDDDLLLSIISDIRSELRKDRTAFRNKQVLDLVESNRRRRLDSTDSNDGSVNTGVINASSESGLDTYLRTVLSNQVPSLLSDNTSVDDTAPGQLISASCELLTGHEPKHPSVTSEMLASQMCSSDTTVGRELEEEILQLSKSLTELSHRLSKVQDESDGVLPGAECVNDRCNKPIAYVRPLGAIDGRVELVDANETSVNSNNENGCTGVTHVDAPNVVQAKLTSLSSNMQDAAQTSFVHQLCCNACVRLSAIITKNSAEITGLLTKLPIAIKMTVSESTASASPQVSEMVAASGKSVVLNGVDLLNGLDGHVVDVSTCQSSVDPNKFICLSQLLDNYSSASLESKNSPAEKTALSENHMDLETDSVGLAEMTDPENLCKVPEPVAKVLEIGSVPEFILQGFSLLESAPDSHHYKRSDHKPVDPKSFTIAVFKDINLLRSCLPQGIFVKGYEDRMDLFSVMIQGPRRTPYEDGLFFFEVQMPNDYPHSPPLFFYISYCTDRLNPNLYEDGKVCVSLLGTWTGKGTELWNSKSNLLQVLISIQGLILNQEPYYNEAGYEKQKGSQQGLENSRMYNEIAILKLVQSMIKLVKHPVPVFESEIRLHLKTYGRRMISRLRYWLRVMPSAQGASVSLLQPTWPVTKVDESPNTPSSKTDCIASTSSPTSLNSEPKIVASPTATNSDAGNSSSCPEDDSESGTDAKILLPEFPLLPLSRGFVLTVSKLLEQFAATIDAAEFSPISSSTCDTDPNR